MVFQDIPESSQDQKAIHFDASQTAQMGQVRDQIATQMWNDYSRSQWYIMKYKRLHKCNIALDEPNFESSSCVNHQINDNMKVKSLMEAMHRTISARAPTDQPSNSDKTSACNGLQAQSQKSKGGSN
ncbi:Uncharacterized protein Fot_10601 [Forsythia ovata]|uniref:Uncharacterized protein n=1 Tax=Forsythia ovata TaxID=205694 RepID=A0ABD1WHA2_9LAMI